MNPKTCLIFFFFKLASRLCTFRANTRLQFVIETCKIEAGIAEEQQLSA